MLEKMYTLRLTVSMFWEDSGVRRGGGRKKEVTHGWKEGRGAEEGGKGVCEGGGVEDIGAEAEMEGVGSNTKDEELVKDLWQ